MAERVEDLVEVVGVIVDPHLRPKCLHNLLAVQMVAWGQSEQLQEAPGLLQAPPILFDNSRANPGAKAAEQLDAYGLRLPTTDLPTGAVRRAAVLVLFGGYLPLRATSQSFSSFVRGSRLHHWLLTLPKCPTSTEHDSKPLSACTNCFTVAHL